MFSRSKISLALTNTLRFFFVIGAVTVLQRYLGAHGAGQFAISLLETVWWAAILLFAPVWGAISDITGKRKPLLALSIGLTALTLPLFGYLESTAAILGLKFVMGVFSAGFPPIALALASEYGDQAHRGRNMSIFNASKSIGFIAGRLIAGALLTVLLFSQTFWALGAVGLVGLIASFFLEGDGDGTKNLDWQTLRTNIRKRLIPSRSDGVFADHGLIYLFTGIAVRKAGTLGIFSLIVVYLTQAKGISDLVMGLLLALNPATQTIFMLVFGNITDRIGRKKVFSLGFLLSIPVPLIFAYAAGPLGLAAGFILLGFSFSALASGSTAFIGDVAPDYRQAELLGFRKTAQGVAGIVGSLTAGIMASVLGYRGMLFAMAGLMALGSMIAILGTTETFITD
ncbi:MAG: MFS transporter [Candidatus Nanohaloarchaea archaeon]|nr:MFS transporter [Candidatus Nanohaloarchaea archaeon]